MTIWSYYQDQIDLIHVSAVKFALLRTTLLSVFFKCYTKGRFEGLHFYNKGRD